MAELWQSLIGWAPARWEELVSASFLGDLPGGSESCLFWLPDYFNYVFYLLIFTVYSSAFQLMLQVRIACWVFKKTAMQILWSEVLVAQSCPTLCDPKDCSQPGYQFNQNFLGKRWWCRGTRQWYCFLSSLDDCNVLLNVKLLDYCVNHWGNIQRRKIAKILTHL